MDNVILKLCCFRCTWEGYHIAYVLHARYEEHQSLEAQTETGVRSGTETTGVQIPPHIFHRDMPTLDLFVQQVQTLLTHATADDLTDLREEHIRTLHGLAVLVDLHIERLDILRIVGHDDGFLEMFLYEETLVLGAQVVAPVAGELKFLTVLDGFLENANTLRVR